MNRSGFVIPEKAVSRLIEAETNLDSRVRGNDESREKQRAEEKPSIFIV